MKEILSVIKEVESDFVSQNEKFNSYLELGSSYFSGNEYDKALGIFEKAIEEEPKNSGGWIGKAITHLAMSEVANINSVNINDYVERAINNSDKATIEKYLQAITLYYGYQYSAAIKLYIEQTNQAIVEKKKAQVAAVIGIATAVAGGAIANKSKSFTGTFIGYGMLAGGVGATIKKGYDSFSLDKLSKSLYGNAFAQSILSVPTIQSCHKIYEYSDGDLKHNVGVILTSWKESVIYLFQNEKESFTILLNDITNIDNLINPEKRDTLNNKIDEIIYFMDMLGLDESEDFNKATEIKIIFSKFIKEYDKERLSKISDKRNLASAGCIIVAILVFLFANLITDKLHLVTSESGIPGLFIVIGCILTFIYFKRKRSKINNESGIEEIHNQIKEMKRAINMVKVEPKDINLKLLGL